ncbi:MAG: flagellar assembly protein FliH [Bacillota bacterium]|uniref:flagellar assembly protein FliH n=1 Tax=Rossellomorea sp. FM04394 TaxID=3243076 RepID=UPI0035A59D82
MSRIIKSSIAQTIHEGEKVISLKRVKPLREFKQYDPDDFELNTAIRADHIIEEAKEKADRIIEEAKQMTLHAEIQIEREREKWVIEREQLMQEAYNAGFLQGEEEGRNKGYQEYQQRLMEANEMTERNKQQFLDYIHNAEKVIVSLGITCAEKIMNCKLEDEPDHFLSIVEQGLKEVRGLPHIQIHVHPSKHRLLAENKNDLEVMFPMNVQCFIYASDDLKPEECYIETNQGRVIVSVDSQLKELKLKLLHLLEGDVE